MTREREYSSDFFLLLHISRNPWQLIDPPLYGEEGRNFFLDQFTLGPAALWKTYAGYLHLFPRLVALVYSGLPIEQLVLPFHLSALVAHALLLFAICLFSECLSTDNRTLMLFCSILILHGGEVFLNLPNTINFLGAIPLLLYLAPRRGWLHNTFETLLVICRPKMFSTSQATTLHISAVSNSSPVSSML